MSAQPRRRPKSRPTRISEEHMTHHREMVADLKVALARKEAIEAEAAEVNDVLAGFRAWARKLNKAYGIDPNRDVGVDEDGSIIYGRPTS